MKRYLCFSLALGLLLLFALSALAQQASTGSITGTVTDPSGQVVPGATVKITSELNGESRSGMTNESGDYFFGAVEPGNLGNRLPGADKPIAAPAPGDRAQPKTRIEDVLAVCLTPDDSLWLASDESVTLARLR